MSLLLYFCLVTGLSCVVWDFCYSIPQSFSGPLVIGNPCAYPWGLGVLRFLIPLSTPRRSEASKPSCPRPKDIGMMQRELRYSLCPICMGQGLLSTSILFIMQLCNISNPTTRTGPISIPRSIWIKLRGREI